LLQLLVQGLGSKLLVSVLAFLASASVSESGGVDAGIFEGIDDYAQLTAVFLS